MRYPRYVDTYRRYLRDDTMYRRGHSIPRYIVAIQNTIGARYSERGWQSAFASCCAVINKFDTQDLYTVIN